MILIRRLFIAAAALFLFTASTHAQGLGDLGANLDADLNAQVLDGTAVTSTININEAVGGGAGATAAGNLFDGFSVGTGAPLQQFVIGGASVAAELNVGAGVGGDVGAIGVGNWAVGAPAPAP